MSHRIDIRDTEIPKHLDEIGYLTDLSMAIKVLLHDIRDASEYTPQLDFVMLARWSIEYAPNLVGCNNLHQGDIAAITLIVTKLMDGLKVDNPLRDITRADVDAIGKVRRNLEQCIDRMVWR